MRGQRAHALAAMVAIAVGAVMVGCGSAAPARHGSRPAAIIRALVPPGGSPALARTVGRQMLAGLILPPGARRIGAQRQPMRSAVIGSDDLVDVSRFYWLPQSLDAASSFLQAHVPAGDTSSGTGSGATGQGGTEFFLSVSYSLTRPPAGIDQNTMLLATLAAGPRGGTIMRADAEIVWYPPRTAAEYLDPADFRSVTITATLVNLRGKARTIMKTFGRPVIDRLAEVLNGLRTLSPPGPLSCPEMAGSTFTLLLTPNSALGRAMVISPAGCVGELITVAGKAQPVLQDFESHKVTSVIGPLLGVRRSAWY
jgi:hypothetical protein